MPTVRGPYRKPVPIRGQPGELIDPAIQFDVFGITRKYKVKVTDGYAPTGHTAGGEHPLGLAIDFVPDTARGGTWADVDRLIRDAVNSKAFRFVGYDGRFGSTRVAGHGPPAVAGGNAHGHLSWFGRDGEQPKKFLAKEVGGPVYPTVPTAVRGTVLDAVGGVVGLVTGNADEAKDAAANAAKDAANATAKALVDTISGLIKKDGARAAFYLVFILGGTTLAMIGLARSVGVGVDDIPTAPSIATAAARKIA